MISPFTLPPSPAAQTAAAEVIERVHAYMRAHPESELHRQGKMFGVMIVENSEFSNQYSVLAAFSAMLDGSYHHEGFVPPVWVNGLGDEWISGLGNGMPIGHSKAESQRLQRLLFANYNFVNGLGESKNLLDIFASEKPILPPDEWFGKGDRLSVTGDRLPPSGAGECCAPKLLQYALTHGLRPIALAEFWVGAPSRTEIRTEGMFYAPCSGKCVPILRHMLRGIEVDPAPEERAAEELCRRMEVIYEDDAMVVVNKPAGLLSVPGKTDELCVESYMRAQRPEWQMVRAAHRLDQDTSGLLVLAKTPEVYKTLQACFQRRDICKRYEAVLTSERMNELTNEGEISLPLLPNPYDRPRQMVDRAHGKPAITRYKIRARYADGTMLVDFFPLTGRTHQLRVHAAHPDGLNAPIVGDRLYGIQKADRMLLHAAELIFPHPVTSAEVHFLCPSDLPDSLH